jgi:hypothetical protein
MTSWPVHRKSCTPQLHRHDLTPAEKTLRRIRAVAGSAFIIQDRPHPEGSRPGAGTVEALTDIAISERYPVYCPLNPPSFSAS